MATRRLVNDVRGGGAQKPGILRAATDELGVTTPKGATRRRRKGPMRVAVYKGRRARSDGRIFRRKVL